MDEPPIGIAPRGGGLRRVALVGAGALAAFLLACGQEAPLGPRLTPGQLEQAVRERASELWDPLAVDLIEAWPGERHELEVACNPDPAAGHQLRTQQLMPYEIRFWVAQPPPWRSGVAVEVESSWARELILSDGSRGAGQSHELLVGVSVTLRDRIRLPEDEDVRVAVIGRNVSNGFWLRLYALGQGRVAIEVPVNKKCPVFNLPQNWWFN